MPYRAAATDAIVIIGVCDYDFDKCAMQIQCMRLNELLWVVSISIEGSKLSRDNKITKKVAGVQAVIYFELACIIRCSYSCFALSYLVAGTRRQARSVHIGIQRLVPAGSSISRPWGSTFIARRLRFAVMIG